MLGHQGAGVLGVHLGDDVAVVVLGDGQQPVEVLDVGGARADRVEQVLVRRIAQLPGAHVGAHGGEFAQHPFHHGGVPGGEEVGQVLHGDAQGVDGGEHAVGFVVVVAGGVHRVRDRGQRGHVPDHGHGAVLRVQRQCHPVLLDQRVHRGALGGLDPVVGDAVTLGRRLHLGVLGVEEHRQLRLVQVFVVLDRGGLQDGVGVVEHHAEVAQPAHAGLGADGGLPGLDARVAEGALLGLAGAVVEVDLLVGAAGDAEPPASAAVLVDQDDAVLLALVHGSRRAGGDAGRVEAVFADPRQIEHERLLELHPHPLRHAHQVRVGGGVRGGSGEVVVPVGAVRGLHVPAGQL